MCKGINCEQRRTCYRYLANANPHRQSYFSETPTTKEGKCDEYIMWLGASEWTGQVREEWNVKFIGRKSWQYLRHKLYPIGYKLYPTEKKSTREGTRKKNKQMSENKLNFLKSQISVFNPDWTKEQVEMEAIRIYNEANTIDDDDEGCLYCGS